MKLNTDGWIDSSYQCLSPNCNERPENTIIDLIVLHYISLPPNEFGGSYIHDLFLNQIDCQSHPFFASLKDLHVSSHFLIQRTGELTQFVPTIKRAWHAGVSSFNGRTNCNDFSIGIELEGTQYVPFTPKQYETLVALIQALCHKHPIRTITGHEHIAPIRKSDPGPFFDWQKLQQIINSKSIQTQTGQPLSFWLPRYPMSF